MQLLTKTVLSSIQWVLFKCVLLLFWFDMTLRGILFVTCQFIIIIRSHIINPLFSVNNLMLLIHSMQRSTKTVLSSIKWVLFKCVLLLFWFDIALRGILFVPFQFIIIIRSNIINYLFSINSLILLVHCMRLLAKIVLFSKKLELYKCVLPLFLFDIVLRGILFILCQFIIIRFNFLSQNVTNTKTIKISRNNCQLMLYFYNLFAIDRIS